ncbi:MAG: hypothetical protein AAGC55_34005 [Myxococcota bacterium]
MGRDTGVTEAQITGLADYPTSPAFDELERLCLRLADAMCETPAEIDDPLFSALAARLSHAQLVELSSTIAWENYRARYNRALGVTSDGFSAGAVCAVPVGALARG